MHDEIIEVLWTIGHDYEFIDFTQLMLFVDM